MATVGIDGIYKEFGAVKALSDISFTVEDGEFAVLVGPSGCGKSTLLRMISGLDSVSGGVISIGGQEVTRVAPKDRDIAMVFQSYALYPHMTVGQNMGFGLKMRNAPEAEMVSRVAEAASILGLTEHLDRYPRQLSGGQRQRVAMGRAIVRNPQVFLFDEPLSNLDAKLRVRMRGEIRDLHQKIGSTTIYVTHDQVEAMTMADKIIVMNAGRVEQIGAPLELYDNPRNTFVAEFLGSPSVNLLRGSVGQGVFRTETGFDIPLDLAAPSGPAILGIRPEYLRIDPNGAIPARVQVIEPTGSETILILDAGGKEIVMTMPERCDLGAGTEVRLSLRPGRTMLFDAVTEERLVLPAA